MDSNWSHLLKGCWVSQSLGKFAVEIRPQKQFGQDGVLHSDPGIQDAKHYFWHCCSRALHVAPMHHTCLLQNEFFNSFTLLARDSQNHTGRSDGWAEAVKLPGTMTIWLSVCSTLRGIPVPHGYACGGISPNTAMCWEGGPGLTTIFTQKEGEYLHSKNSTEILSFQLTEFPCPVPVAVGISWITWLQSLGLLWLI